MIAPIILHTNNYPLNNRLCNRPSFSSNGRFYNTQSGGPMETYSYFFREDFPWKRFVPFIKDHFKNTPKVNVIICGCSDGSELYSLKMSMMENFDSETFAKFLPFKGYDIDPEIIKAAKSGYVLLNTEDEVVIGLHVKNQNKYLSSASDFKLKIDNNPSHINFRNELCVYELNTYKIKKNLSDNVEFHQNDAFDILNNLNDNSNTIFFFRNALGHLPANKAKEFAELASKKLKKGSLVVIGDFDSRQTFIRTYLFKNGFTEIMRNVWQKDSPLEMKVKDFKLFLSKGTLKID